MTSIVSYGQSSLTGYFYRIDSTQGKGSIEYCLKYFTINKGNIWCTEYQVVKIKTTLNDDNVNNFRIVKSNVMRTTKNNYFLEDLI